MALKRTKKEKTVPRKPKGIDSSLVKGNPIYAKLLSFEPRRRDLRRAIIIEAAIHCIQKVGIEETNFETIGRASGMGRAHVKYYFKDRDDIVRAAIEFVATTAQMVTLESISRANSPRERLDAFVDGCFLWAEKYPEHLPVLGLNYYYASFLTPYKKLHTEIRRLGEERATAIIREIHPDFSPERADHLGKAIQNLILGNLLDWATTQSQVTIDELRKRTLVSVRLLIEK